MMHGLKPFGTKKEKDKGKTYFHISNSITGHWVVGIKPFDKLKFDKDKEKAHSFSIKKAMEIITHHKGDYMLEMKKGSKVISNKKGARW